MINRDGLPPDVAANLNDVIYRSATIEIADWQEGETLDDPDSPTSQRLDSMIAKLREFSVDDKRIGAVAAVAQVRYFGDEPQFEIAKMEVWSDEAQEARRN